MATVKLLLLGLLLCVDSSMAAPGGYLAVGGVYKSGAAAKDYLHEARQAGAFGSQLLLAFWV